MSIVANIEKSRGELNKLGIGKDLQDSKVIRMSQSLDKLINEYYQNTQEKIGLDKDQ